MQTESEMSQREQDRGRDGERERERESITEGKREGEREEGRLQAARSTVGDPCGCQQTRCL